MIKPLMSLIICFTCVATAQSADYYVEPKASPALNLTDEGATAWANAQSISTPTSVKTAMNRAVAGDTTYFLSGTYSITWSDPVSADIAMLMPVNSGTSINRITFAENAGATVVIDMVGIDTTPTNNHYNEHIIGSNGSDYITWDGFKLIGNGGTWPAGTCAYNGDGIEYLNIEIDGGDAQIDFNSNADAMRIEGLDGVLIQKCQIYDWTNINNDANCAAIKAYAVTNAIIENNEITNCTTGIRPKSGNDHWIIRYNFLEGGWHGIFPSNNTHWFNYNEIYHNIIANSGYAGLRVYPENSAADNDNKYYNNTIYNSGDYNAQFGGGHASGNGDIIYNNIFDSPGGAYNLRFYCDGTMYTEESDHNNFGNTSFNSIWRMYCTSSVFTSLSSWQSSGILRNAVDVGCGSNQNPGCGSVAVSPSFINTSGNMDEIADFEPTTSAVLTGGRSSDLMGADVSLVGIAGGEAEGNTNTNCTGGTSSAAGGTANVTIQ